ncbi:MAG: OST-HTH/LOTUS domain-containing protein, partial [Polaromonas sp.]
LVPPVPQSQVDAAAEIFKRAIRLLAETQGDAWVSRAAILHMIKRLDSTFDPREYGHPNFLAMLNAFDALLEIRDGESDQMIRLR